MCDCQQPTCRTCCPVIEPTATPKKYVANGCFSVYVHLCPAVQEECSPPMSGIRISRKGFTAKSAKMQAALEADCNFGKTFQAV